MTKEEFLTQMGEAYDNNSPLYYIPSKGITTVTEGNILITFVENPEHVLAGTEQLCKDYGYQEKVNNPDYDANAEDLVPQKIANPVTKEEFANKKWRQFGVNAANNYYRQKAEAEALAGITTPTVD